MTTNDTSYIDGIETGIDNIVSSISPSLAFTYALSTDDSKSRPWVCVIEGVDSKFGFKRSFIQSSIKNLKAPFTHYKKYVWELEPFKVYEFKNFLGDFSSEDKFAGYFGVTNIGVKELTKDELRRSLHMKIKGDENSPSKKTIAQARDERVKNFKISRVSNAKAITEFKDNENFYCLGKEDSAMSDEDIEREESLQINFNLEGE